MGRLLDLLIGTMDLGRRDVNVDWTVWIQRREHTEEDKRCERQKPFRGGESACGRRWAYAEEVGVVVVVMRDEIDGSNESRVRWRGDVKWEERGEGEGESSTQSSR